MDLHLVAPAAQGDRVFQLGDLFFPDGSNGWSSNQRDWVAPFTAVFPFSKARHGVELKTQGELTFAPNPEILDFIVRAVKGTESVELRVHRHHRLVEFELTPARLTLREGQSARFTILAVFEDDFAGSLVRSVADLSLHPGMAWTRSSGTDGDATVTSDGLITAGQAGATVDLQVVLPESLFPGETSPNRTKSAQVVTQAAWGSPLTSSDALVLLAGPGLANGTDVPNDIPNILILPDGFPSRDEFERVARNIVNRVKTYSTAAPFNLLLRDDAKALNCWMAWVPSPETGGNTLSELQPIPENQKDRSKYAFPPVPAAQEPTGPIQALEHLIYRVGLPTPVEVATKDFQTQQARWLSLYNEAYLAGVTRALWEGWKTCGTRFLARERDTAFGMSIGGRPQLPGVSPSVIGWHPFRAQRRDIDGFLGQLSAADTTGNLVTLGQLWTSGKDRDLVVIVSLGARERGTRWPEYNRLVAVTVTDRADALVIPPPQQPGIVDVAEPPLPVLGVALRQIGTFLHEISHTLHIGDEYSADGLNLPQSRQRWIGDPYWNLVLASAVTANGRISAAKIPWGRWPRIVEAGIIAARPSLVAGSSPLRAVVPLRPGDAERFARAVREGRLASNGLLRMRRRPFVDSSLALDDVTSPLLRLESIDVSNRQLTVSEGAAGSLEPWMAKITVGFTSRAVLLIALRLGHEGEQFLIHPAIGAHMENSGSSGSPLNRAPGAQNTCIEAKDAVLFPEGLAGLPSTVQLPQIQTRLIGLYDGGDRFSCGLYHAAGICMMREQRIPVEFEREALEPDEARASLVIAGLCHVCRYILVDQLAPQLHGRIDDLYSKAYPR